MNEIWETLTANMTYARSQNYTNMVVGKHEIQTFKVVVLVLLLCYCHLMFLYPQMHIPY